MRFLAIYAIWRFICWFCKESSQSFDSTSRMLIRKWNIVCLVDIYSSGYPDSGFHEKGRKYRFPYFYSSVVWKNCCFRCFSTSNIMTQTLRQKLLDLYLQYTRKYISRWGKTYQLTKITIIPHTNSFWRKNVETCLTTRSFESGIFRYSI